MSIPDKNSDLKEFGVEEFTEKEETVEVKTEE